jgi:hypothetical protein
MSHLRLVKRQKWSLFFINNIKIRKNNKNKTKKQKQNKTNQNKTKATTTCHPQQTFGLVGPTLDS